MKVEGKNYCDASRVRIHPISQKIAKKIIVEKHYTHAWTSARYSLGIFYINDEEDIFGNKESLIGCIIYGFPAGRSVVDSLSELVTNENVLELKRLYIDDGYGSNIESYVIGQSFKWLRENDKDIKLLISYADNGQEHLGTIYQATNWLYQGTSAELQLMPNYSISLQKDPYKWAHSRNTYSVYGSSNLEHLKKEIGRRGYKKFWRLKEDPKHRYVQIIAQNRKERKKLLSSLKYKGKPYPTSSAEFSAEVEEYDTYPPEDDIDNKFW